MLVAGALAVLAALVLLGDGGRNPAGGARPAPSPAFGVLLKGGTSWLCVELADDAIERASGLARRDSIGDYDGMAFIFSAESGLAVAAVSLDSTPTAAPQDLLTSAGFWMRDTRIPLDLVYVGADGRAQQIVTMEPCLTEQCPVYPPDAPYLYAVELPGGWASEFGIRVGKRLELSGSCIPFDRD